MSENVPLFVILCVDLVVVSAVYMYRPIGKYLPFSVQVLINKH